MSSKDAVRQTSEAFYAALNRMANGDATSMGDVWLDNPGSTAMHPIGGREVGWAAVKASFEQVAQIASNGKIELTDQLIHVIGM